MTSDGQPGPVTPTGSARWLAVPVLLVLAGVGLAAGRAGRGRPDNLLGIVPGSLAFDVMIFSYLVIAVGAPIAVAALVRRYRDGPGESEAGSVPGVIVVAPIVGLLLLGVLVVALVLLFGNGSRKSAADPGTAAGDHSPAMSTGTLWPVLLAALVAAAIAVVIGVARRPGPDREARRAPVAPEQTGEALREAAQAGRVALAGTDDPRGAVLACYRAMEASLAGGVAAPADSDTPGEVLRRATDAALLRGTGGPELVALFAEARYSRHPFGADQRDAAYRALDAVQAELAVRR